MKSLNLNSLIMCISLFLCDGNPDVPIQRLSVFFVVCWVIFQLNLFSLGTGRTYQLLQDWYSVNAQEVCQGLQRRILALQGALDKLVRNGTWRGTSSSSVSDKEGSGHQQVISLGQSASAGPGNTGLIISGKLNMTFCDHCHFPSDMATKDSWQTLRGREQCHR